MQILNLSATLNVASLEPSINTYRLGEGAGTYEYPELNNKPKINGVTLVGDISSANLRIKTSDLANDSGYISEADIPTATSDLVNDSGFVNSTQVQSVVSDAIPSDISYFNNDVGYITNADIGNIPTRTSQLINDSGYITAADAPVVSVNNMTGAVVLDGSNIEYEQNVSLNSKIDAVEGSIPTQTSQLVNDSGYITNANVPTRTSQLVNDSGFVNSQNIPVQSVNAKTGAVKLTAADIDYDNNNTVAAKIDAVEDSIPTRTSQLVNDSGFVNAQNIIQTGTIEDVAIASFSDGADNVPVSSLIVDIDAVQAGSGDPSPNNIREIIGFTEIDVMRTGVNLWSEDWEVGNIDSNGNNSAANDRIRSKGYIAVKGGLTYYIVMPKPIVMHKYAIDKSYLGSNYFANSTSFTLNNDVAYIRFRTDTSYGDTYNNDISINYPSTDTSYHTFNGGTDTIPLGQTVYGGTLNVTTGELTVTSGYIASYNGEAINEPWISSIDEYVPNTSPSTGAEVVYTLTTPTTVKLTPTEVRTLLGNNNIFADTGKIEKLVYFKTGCEAIAKLIEAMIQ